MDLKVYEQIFEQVKKSQKILIALPENLNTDSLSSGMALWLFLNKLKKDVSIASSGKLPENLKFLPDVSAVQKHIKSSNSLVVSLDTSVKKLEEISYQVDESQNKVRIYLKSKTQEFTEQDFTFGVEKFPLDLIITLGAKSLDDLGSLTTDAADLFFETPKVNIDNKTDNEYFGQINLVDVTATSVAESLAELLQKYEDQLVDEDIATCLLAGIIEKTGSFQRVHTTPRSFIKASELVALGARQQEVIKHIYKTKPLSLLKLWGRALARMKIDEQNKVVYSVLSVVDFEKAEASENDLLPALAELIDNLSDYKVVALIAETKKDSSKLFLAAHISAEPDALAQKLGGKLLENQFGHYRIIETSFPGVQPENVEKDLLYSLSN